MHFPLYVFVTIFTCTGAYSPYCSPSSWTWVDHRPFIAPADACALLQRISRSSSSSSNNHTTTNITRVLFVGDSNVRHAYQAFAMSLSGDYDRGGVRQDAPANCAGNGQFEQWPCRREVPSFDACGGSVRLELEWRQNDHWYMLQGSQHSRSRADVIVWCERSTLLARSRIFPRIFTRISLEFHSGIPFPPILPRSEATSSTGARASTTATAGVFRTRKKRAKNSSGNAVGVAVCPQ